MYCAKMIDGLKKGKLQTKMLAGRYYIPVEITVENGRMLFNFRYNPDLVEEIKTSFEDRKWHGFISGDERKLWSAPITARNLFQLQALQGKYSEDPYKHWTLRHDYTEGILNYWRHRGRKEKLFQHQIDMINWMLNANYYVAAAEMGLGKTLAAIIAAEMCGYYEFGNMFWVGPNPALVAARVDFEYWGTHLDPAFMTYERLKKEVLNWPEGKDAPKIVIFDESSRLKSPKAQRSEAAKYLVEAIRREHGYNCLVAMLTGTPAPKTPVDWWMQAEILRPGFLREANQFLFRERLAFIVEEESATGVGAFKKVKCWKDNESKCMYCAEPKVHANHTYDPVAVVTTSQTYTFHDFAPSVNEVAKLGKRLSGLAGVWYKRDCLDLPEKRYVVHNLQPSNEVMNLARMIVRTTSRAADALIKLRTLSDGFLYKEVETGEHSVCPGCQGAKRVNEYRVKNNPGHVLSPQEKQDGCVYIYEQDEWGEYKVIGKEPVEIEEVSIECNYCNGEGVIPKMTRTTSEIECPKIDLLKQLLGEHEEVGRFNIYAGFTGSIERIRRTVLSEGWAVIKADGQGWEFSHPANEMYNMTREQMVKQYQSKDSDFSKIVFLGQPGAAGMGLTLTASPSTFFYSNDFNPENRSQAEDRGHRLSMDRERGGLIIDCTHLPTDAKILASLRQSRDLMRMPMDVILGDYV